MQLFFKILLLMKYFYLFILLNFISFSFASNSLHNGTVKGIVYDEKSNAPIYNARVIIKSLNKMTYTDELGFFQFDDIEAGDYNIEVSYLGYENNTSMVVLIDHQTSPIRIDLKLKNLALAEVTISANALENKSFLSAIDLQLRPINTSQDVLKMVPGLFIAQHAGGGKAEQIFLRGFDIDHGTDIALFVDGIPVNMVSHAHGQGYADLHFLIPETIDRVSFSKGPFDPKIGNFATAGQVEFKTKSRLDKNLVSLELGKFNSQRVTSLFKLLNSKDQQVYTAIDFNHSDGYFKSPQDYRRFNGLLKYNAKVSEHHYVTGLISGFTSSWDASGQIPERAVQSGAIDRFGSIDYTEGGLTSRYNASIQINSNLSNNDFFKNQFFYSKYRFELYSNFTFFLEDSINGDQIKQKENRDLFGYKSEYSKAFNFGRFNWNSAIGVQWRLDATSNSELSHTKDRIETLNQLAYGDIEETNYGLYTDQSFHIGTHWSGNLGVRFDQFNFIYKNRLTPEYDHLILNKHIVSPKLNLNYKMNSFLSLNAHAGYGFHSNDARVNVSQTNRDILPKALGMDFGVHLKPMKSVLLTATLWQLDLDQEFVYVGDAAIVEPSGKTKRHGVEVSLRYQIARSLYFDTDINYTNARARGELKGEDYIPLAAKWSSIGGITLESKKGFNGSLRYRYLGDRSANEDHSLIAKGYLVFDALLNYTKDKWEIGFSVQNLLNTDWKEAQFETDSRLQNESEPVTEIHFTPGTPLFLKSHLTIYF